MPIFTMAATHSASQLRGSLKSGALRLGKPAAGKLPFRTLIGRPPSGDLVFTEAPPPPRTAGAPAAGPAPAPAFIDPELEELLQLPAVAAPAAAAAAGKEQRQSAIRATLGLAHSKSAPGYF